MTATTPAESTGAKRSEVSERCPLDSGMLLDSVRAITPLLGRLAEALAQEALNPTP